MKKTTRRVGLVLVLFLFAGTGAGLITLLVAYRSLTQVPEYYQHALEAPEAAQKEAGDELEKRVLQLHNEVTQTGRWEALFSDEVINGWLAVDLPEKFPDALPRDVRDPRVAIEENRLLIACWHEHPQLRAVINLELQVQLTEEPNVVAVRICQARAGVIPLPLTEYLELITKAARKADISLRWQEVEGDPVALIKVPRHHREFAHEVRIDSVILQDGELYLSGTTGSESVAREIPSDGDRSSL